MQGTVEWYRRPLRYGFIAVSDNFEENVFVHRRDFTKGVNALFEGDLVEFDLTEFNGRRCATNVRVIRRAKTQPTSASSEVISAVRNER